MISVYSVIWTILNCSLMAFVLMLLRRNTSFLRKYGTSSLILLTLCCTIRMLFPVEFPNFQFIIQDKYILPLIQGSYERYRHFLKISPLIIYFWAVGTILFILIYFYRYFLVQKDIRSNAVPAEDHINKILRDLDPECPMKVFVSPDISVPITAGIINPQIYITDEKYDRKNLHYVILHEYNHWKRKDIWKKTGLFLLSSIMWWNPFSYILRNEFIQILEFRCDSSLCTDLTPQEETEYLDTLFQTNSFLKNSEKKIKTNTTTMEFIGTCKSDQSTLRQRFSLLIYGQEEGNKLKKLLLHLMVFLWMLASYYYLPQPYYDPVMPDDSEIVYYDDIIISKQNDDTYTLEVNDDRHDLETDIPIGNSIVDDNSHFNYTVKEKGFLHRWIKKIKKRIHSIINN